MGARRAKLPCPKCGSTDIATPAGCKIQRTDEGLVRTRECLACVHQFHTLESYFNRNLISQFLPAEPLRLLLLEAIDSDIDPGDSLGRGPKGRIRKRLDMSEAAMTEILSRRQKRVQRYNGERWVKALGYDPYEVWPDYF